MSEDKRLNRRLGMILKVDYQKREDFLADFAANASSGGMFIATTKEFKIGDEISFDISFPGLLDPIRCRGEVRWRRTSHMASAGEPVGIGVAFLFASDEERQQIEALIDKLSTPSVLAKPRSKETFRVLLVEPNAEARELYRGALRAFHHLSQGFRLQLVVDEAETVEAALSELRKPGPPATSLIVLDFSLPDKGAERVIAQVRSATRRLPIIVIGDGSEDTKRAAYQAGADLYFGRPVGMGQLFESLQRLIWLQDELEAEGDREEIECEEAEFDPNPDEE